MSVRSMLLFPTRLSRHGKAGATSRLGSKEMKRAALARPERPGARRFPRDSRRRRSSDGPQPFLWLDGLRRRFCVPWRRAATVKPALADQTWPPIYGYLNVSTRLPACLGIAPMLSCRPQRTWRRVAVHATDVRLTGRCERYDPLIGEPPPSPSAMTALCVLYEVGGCSRGTMAGGRLGCGRRSCPWRPLSDEPGLLSLWGSR